MDNPLDLTQIIDKRDPKFMSMLVDTFGRSRPQYGKVTVTFQNGNIVCVGKEETFKPT